MSGLCPGGVRANMPPPPDPGRFDNFPPNPTGVVYNIVREPASGARGKGDPTSVSFWHKIGAQGEVLVVGGGETRFFTKQFYLPLRIRSMIDVDEGRFKGSPFTI